MLAFFRVLERVDQATPHEQIVDGLLFYYFLEKLQSSCF